MIGLLSFATTCLAASQGTVYAGVNFTGQQQDLKHGCQNLDGGIAGNVQSYQLRLLEDNRTDRSTKPSKRTGALCKFYEKRDCKGQMVFRGWSNTDMDTRSTRQVLSVDCQDYGG